jgi:heme-degrading monooxygenase HmoA
MIAVIFEFTPVQGRFVDYKALADGLAENLSNHDGFISVERFESITNKGKIVSLSFWRDEEAVGNWRNLHRDAQKHGRGGVLASYRMRVSQVLRDYTMDERTQVPEDSRKVHG